MSKATKLIIFTAQANAHDTSVKARSVMKWLRLGHEVRVQVSGKEDRKQSMESIIDQLRRDIKSGAKFVEQPAKSDKLSYILRPTQDSPNIVVPESGKARAEDFRRELDSMVSEKDIFSDDFEKELKESIREERNLLKSKSRRKE